MKFSVLIPIYYKENPQHFRDSLKSIKEQTLQSDEIVIVKDGKLTDELENVLKEYASILPLKIVTLAENKGMGIALSEGVNACSNEIIARMDSDDICRADRFEKQINFLEENPDIDAVGSWISEFTVNPEKIDGHRTPPCTHEEIIAFAKRRSPMNHMTVVYKRSAVLKAGNYKKDLLEDYNLWVRMLQSGAKFANIPEYLVNVRAGEDMIARRCGWKYAVCDFRAMSEFYQLGFLSFSDFLFNITLRVPLRLMPAFLLKCVYRFLRTK